MVATPMGVRVRQSPASLDIGLRPQIFTHAVRSASHAASGSASEYKLSLTVSNVTNLREKSFRHLLKPMIDCLQAAVRLQTPLTHQFYYTLPGHQQQHLPGVHRDCTH